MTVETRSKRRLLRSKEQGVQLLLPGIPNDLSLDAIASKLSWKDCQALSSVSRSWREAIRTHQVYDARVRAHSAKTFVVHIHRRRKSDVIALYSTSDNRCYELPRIPHVANRIPYSCQCISLDGKIYVIGGERYAKKGHVGLVSAEVFVLDVAGQREWKQCASMQEPRLDFGCGIQDGKIYAFGGIGQFDDPATESEVYDPKVDAWSLIMAMPSLRFHHQVATIGEELFVYGGEFFDWEHFALDPNEAHDPAVLEYHAKLEAHEDFCLVHLPECMEVYHPARNEWRVDDRFGRYPTFETLFMAEGKFHFMNTGKLAIHDMDTNLWTKRHTYSFAGLRLAPRIWPKVSLAVNGELFVRVELVSISGVRKGERLLRSVGFSGENEEIVWQKTSCSCRSEQCEGPPVMCTILL